MKRGIFTFTIILIVLCQTVPAIAFELPQGYSQPVFTEVTGVPGYVASAKTARAIYFFGNETEEERLRLLYGAEVCMEIAEAVYGMKPSNRWPLELYYNNAEYENHGRPDAYTINPGKSWQLGVVFSHMSGGSLPAWLCAGLELYWLNQYDLGRFSVNRDIEVTRWIKETSLKECPGFGDQWFVPGLVGNNELSEQAASVALAFTVYLEGNGLTEELVQAYLNDFRDGERLREDAWRGLHR